MFNRFQQLVNYILENNAAGSGGVFGTPIQAVYNPPINIQSGDTIQPGDGRNIYGGVFSDSKKKRKRKNKKNKTPLVIKRNLQRNEL
jgi:hypothetical protein